MANNNDKKGNSKELPKNHIQKNLSAKLDKSDPLRYRQTLQVVSTPIKYWIYISVASSLGLLLWSIFGRIPQRVISAGVLTNPYEITTIKEPSGIIGKYVKISVTDGEEVKKDQIIAKLEVESLKEDVDSAKKSYEEINNLYNIEYESELFKSIIDEQKKIVELNLDYFNDANIYFQKGAISKSVLRGAEQTYQSSLQNLLSIQNQAFTAKGNVINAKTNLDKAITNEERKTNLKAPYDGKVLQIFRNVGSKTEVNGTLMQISRANSDALSVLAYFTARDAASLEVGQTVRILPDNVKANTVGQLKGNVKEISSIPISQTEASSILGSNVIADALTSNNKNIQVKVDLIKTDDNPTGYEWVNGNGPDENLTNQFPRIGIMGNVSVITGSIPPITLGLPALKKFFGID